jgi:hypothetical protein
MSFPSSSIVNRKIGLFCARLIVQCAIGSFDPQIGIETAVCFDISGVEPVAHHEREINVPKYSTTQEARRSLPHSPPV